MKVLKLEPRGVSWSKLLDTLYRQAHKVEEIQLCDSASEPRLSAILANCKMFNRYAKTILHSDMRHYDEKLWREIIRFNTLDELHVHLNGDIQARKNVKRLQRLKRHLNWAKPEIHIYCTPAKESIICLQDLAPSVATR